MCVCMYVYIIRALKGHIWKEEEKEDDDDDEKEDEEKEKRASQNPFIYQFVTHRNLNVGPGLQVGALVTNPAHRFYSVFITYSRSYHLNVIKVEASSLQTDCSLA